MNKRFDIDKKVNEALESLEGIQRAEPAPYFFTRVKARLLREESNIWETTGSFLTRPAIAFAGLVLILCINAFVLFEKASPKTIDPLSGNNTSTTIPVEEFALTDVSNNFDYENLDLQ